MNTPYPLSNHELAIRKKQDCKASRNHQSKMSSRLLRKQRARAALEYCHFAMANAPLHLLKNPKAETAGKSGADYGQHQQALNYNYRQIDTSGKTKDVKVGSLSIGLSYDGDWKTTANGGRTRCLQSDKHSLSPGTNSLSRGVSRYSAVALDIPWLVSIVDNSASKSNFFTLRRMFQTSSAVVEYVDGYSGRIMSRRSEQLTGRPGLRTVIISFNA
jgi:hypothetical protein